MSNSSAQDRTSGGFGRRDFLKGSSALATATALGTSQADATAAVAAEATTVQGPEMKGVTLRVNGKDAAVQVEPRMTLLEVLRYQLQLTGAKPVSSDGSSGASTVLLAGKLVCASTVLALDCVGKAIQTVESLGGEKPDPVATAFVHRDGMQCGFCTPGFVVAVRAFLDKNPGATEDQIRAGLNGNLCRCGTYANVIEAALEVVKGAPRG